MKRYIYTWSEKTPRMRHGWGYTKYTVRIYRITRTGVEFLVQMTDTFVSEFQLVLMALETVKGPHAAPRKLFARSPMGGHACGNAWVARKEGLADITRIS